MLKKIFTVKNINSFFSFIFFHLSTCIRRNLSLKNVLTLFSSCCFLSWGYQTYTFNQFQQKIEESKFKPNFNIIKNPTRNQKCFNIIATNDDFHNFNCTVNHIIKIHYTKKRFSTDQKDFFYDSQTVYIPTDYYVSILNSNNPKIISTIEPILDSYSTIFNNVNKNFWLNNNNICKKLDLDNLYYNDILLIKIYCLDILDKKFNQYFLEKELITEDIYNKIYNNILPKDTYPIPKQNISLKDFNLNFIEQAIIKNEKILNSHK